MPPPGPGASLPVLLLALLAACGEPGAPAPLDAGLPAAGASRPAPPDAGLHGPDAGLAGRYRTRYRLTLAALPGWPPELGLALSALRAVLDGGAACPGAPGEASLGCLAGELFDAGVPPPPWLPPALEALGAALGPEPVALRAEGRLALEVAPGGQLLASERWEALWVEAGGRRLELLADGRLQAVAPPFTGALAAGEVRLGPREVALDRLPLRLVEAALEVGSGGAVRDVGQALDAALCLPLLRAGAPAALGCLVAARSLDLELELRGPRATLALDAQAAGLGAAGLVEGRLQGALRVGPARAPLAPASSWAAAR